MCVCRVCMFFLCVYVWLCVCERERERNGEHALFFDRNWELQCSLDPLQVVDKRTPAGKIIYEPVPVPRGDDKDDDSEDESDGDRSKVGHTHIHTPTHAQMEANLYTQATTLGCTCASTQAQFKGVPF